MSVSAAAGAAPRARPGRVSWRAVEWWSAGIALFLFSGAVFPLALAPEGLDAGAKTQLRLVSLPAYAAAALILARHPPSLGVALSRSLPLAALAALSLASVAWSISGTVSLRRALALLLSTALAYAIAIRFTPRQLAVLTAWVVGPCLAASLALAAVAPGLAFMPSHDGASGLRGVFIHKNVLGWLAALALLVAPVTLRARMAPAPFGFALIALALTCLLASRSATAVVAVFAAAFAYGYLKAFARLRAPGRLILVVATLAVGALALSSFGAVIAPALEALGKDPTLTGRTALWAEVDAAILERPLFGYGYQTFWSDANPTGWAIRERIGWPAPHAHNGYRDMMLSLGAVGFALFLWVALRGLRQAIALDMRRPDEGWSWIATLMGALLVMNAAETLAFVQNELPSTLFTTALAMCALRAPETAGPAAPPS